MEYRIVLFLLVLSSNMVLGQTKNVADLNQEYFDWYNKDIDADGVMGASVNKAYLEFLNKKNQLKR